jgi:hypothetical protein
MAVKRSGVNASRLASRNDARGINAPVADDPLLGQNAGLLSNALEVSKRLSLMIDGQRLLASIPMSLLGSIASFRPWFGHFRSAPYERT